MLRNFAFEGTVGKIQTLVVIVAYAKQFVGVYIITCR